MDSSRLLKTLLPLVHEGEEVDRTSTSTPIVSVKVLRRLLSAIHFRDVATLKHSRRVGLIGVGIASRLGWEQDDLKIVEVAALLHDLGKVGIPDHILRKPGRLSPDEAEFIAIHHRVALNLMQACGIHPGVIEIVAQAHGIHDEELQDRSALGLAARILSVADAYDSLTSRQSYRSAYDRLEALQILDEQSGKQFDRNVVAALGRWLDSPDSAPLGDERAAEVSIHVNAPIDMEARVGAGQLCQLLSYLHLLETLYDAFYIVDSQRRIAIWNPGAGRLFNLPPGQALGKAWRRHLVCPGVTGKDPLDLAFETGQPQCHRMLITLPEGARRDVDAQSVPIQDQDGKVIGVAELVCDVEDSKQNRGQFRSLKMAATRDALTGVFNRGELENKLAELHAGWEAAPGAPYSVMFLDLDHFKQINDRLSHAVGDRVLIEVARLIQDELYSGEIVGRYGGEEFVIVCPETTLETAIERAERLRRAIMNTRMADRDDLRVTASLGVTQVDVGDSVEAVVHRADQALYAAKHEGRNRTCHRRLEFAAPSQEKHVKGGHEDLSHEIRFQTCCAANMLTQKLTAFVEEQAAKILSVSPQLLEVQIGQTGYFVGWSRRWEKMPVKLTVRIQQESPGTQKAGTPRALLIAIVEPLTKSAKPDEFQCRASSITDALRSYLMGEII